MANIEIGFREVPDPYDNEPIVVAVNANCDIIERMFQRGDIDEAQFKAGRKFLGLVEMAEGSRNLVCNLQREPVDCSMGSHDMPLTSIDAGRELARLIPHLGRRDYNLARRLLARDAQAYPDPVSEREKLYQRRRLKDVLEDLAGFWGYVGKSA